VSYKVKEVITAVRDLIGESSESGYYSPSYLLQQLNISIKSRVIPDLFVIGKYGYLYDLIVSSDIEKAMITTDQRYDYFDLTGCASIPFYPSIRAWIDKVRVEILDVDKVFEYEDDDYAYFRPQVLGAIVGNHIRIYGVDAYKWQKVTYDNLLVSTFIVGETITGATSTATGIVVTDAASVLTLKNVSGIFVNDEEIEGGTSSATADVNGTPVNCALDVEYIQIPTYSTTETTVLLSDHVIETFLIPIMCYETIRREPDVPKNKIEAFKSDYIEALKVAAATYQNTVGPGPLPIERLGRASGE